MSMLVLSRLVLRNFALEFKLEEGVTYKFSTRLQGVVKPYFARRVFENTKRGTPIINSKS